MDVVAPRNLTVKEAAAEARVGVALVYGWVADGTLPAYRLGRGGRRGKILIAPADLAATLESFRTSPPPTPAVVRRAATPPPVLKHLSID